MSEATVKEIFTKSEAILNKHNSIVRAPSKDPEMRLVVSEYMIDPHKVSPATRNKNFFGCDCAHFRTWKFCAHALAVAVEANVTLPYLMEVVKKRKS